ncbi:hypothetical protein TP2_01450 [Thioclava pacifica DSM 10166]|uniref:Uncharacterized protein n=1 Tax=Thioclava pacifica DSM 10166 TaxID=1353537 RepID=A0A074JK22_9RHOB|nr:hypothetical protein TP2_01450 [Thioclava pacifica DSM 10166]
MTLPLRVLQNAMRDAILPNVNFIASQLAGDCVIRPERVRRAALFASRWDAEETEALAPPARDRYHGGQRTRMTRR